VLNEDGWPIHGIGLGSIAIALIGGWLFGQSPKDWNAHTAFDGLATLGGWIHALSFDGIQAGFVQPLEAGALLEEG
jgi:hypothetical protein